ncbi:MAG: SH3 domain-containing protein [Patescibacteria group bacterium]
MNTSAYGRDQACMEGSKVLEVIPKGTSVHIIADTDGWYRVEWNGYRLWVGATLIDITQKRFEGDSAAYDLYMSKFSNTITTPAADVPAEPAAPSSSSTPSTPSTPQTPSSVAPASNVSSPAASNAADPALLNRLKGYILLQVQSHGEAWYVDPITGKRYYMKDGPTAYQMMRSFGLGVTESDYQKIASGNTSMKSRLSGRIILRAQAHGEAYYIHPGDLKVYYLQNGDEAYRVMRLYSLGITNTDLGKLAAGEITIK